MKRLLAIAIFTLFATPLHGQYALNYGGVQVTGGVATVASSATPTFSVTLSGSRMVLTANVTTFTLPAGLDGQDYCLNWVQGSGAYTVTPPSNVHGFAPVGATNGLNNQQCFRYWVADSAWLAKDPGVVKQ